MSPSRRQFSFSISPARGPVCLRGDPHHWEHCHRHLAPAVHVCLHWSAAVQGGGRVFAPVHNPDAPCLLYCHISGIDKYSRMFLRLINALSHHQGKFYSCTDNSKQTEGECKWVLLPACVSFYIFICLYMYWFDYLFDFLCRPPVLACLNIGSFVSVFLYVYWLACY